jgi:hypothetical protein
MSTSGVARTTVVYVTTVNNSVYALDANEHSAHDQQARQKEQQQ